jgi:endonuclease/exonuclease/phosphatase family metal-dependent hydrolase
VLAGDFNVRLADSQTLRDLTGPEWGFVNAGAGIDHILVRGAAVTASRTWTKSERTRGGRVLSDHAPIETKIRDDRPVEADRPRSASRG